MKTDELFENLRESFKTSNEESFNDNINKLNGEIDRRPDSTIIDKAKHQGLIWSVLKYYTIRIIKPTLTILLGTAVASLGTSAIASIFIALYFGYGDLFDIIKDKFFKGGKEQEGIEEMGTPQVTDTLSDGRKIEEGYDFNKNDDQIVETFRGYLEDVKKTKNADVLINAAIDLDTMKYKDQLPNIVDILSEALEIDGLSDEQINTLQEVINSIRVCYDSSQLFANSYCNRGAMLAAASLNDQYLAPEKKMAVPAYSYRFDPNSNDRSTYLVRQQAQQSAEKAYTRQLRQRGNRI